MQNLVTAISIALLDNGLEKTVTWVQVPMGDVVVDRIAIALKILKIENANVINLGVNYGSCR